MTLKEYFKFTLGVSEHLTKCRVLWGGSEIITDYFARLPDHAKGIEIRAGRYDEKHDVLTVYTTFEGWQDYVHMERKLQHGVGRCNKNDYTTKGWRR